MLGRSGGWSSVLVRVAVLGLLLLAWVDPGLDRGPVPPDVTLYVDRSASMGTAPTPSDISRIAQALESLPPGTRLRQVHFASGPPALVEGPLLENAAPDMEPSATLQSDLASVLGYGPDPGSDRPHLRVLVSDGRLSSGSGRDVDAWIPILPVPQPGEAGIGRLYVDPSPDGGWTARAPITRPPGTDLSVDLRVNGRRTIADTVPAEGPAPRWHAVSLPQLPPGRHLIELALRDGPHGNRANDVSGHVLEVRGPERALLVSDVAGGPAETLMQSIGWSVDLVRPATLPDQRQGYAAYDLVVLDDIAASRIPRAAVAALASAIRDNGIGLGVLGGARSFSAGGYLGSDIEALLPVVSEDSIRDKPQRIVFLIDASGSMSEAVQGGTRFSYAMQAVELGLASLGEDDESALVFFDREATVFSPLEAAPQTYLDGAGEIAWSPSGGTDLQAALTAGLALFPADDDADHTLVLITDGADGTDAPFDPARIAAAQAQADVTLLPILIVPAEEATARSADDLRTLAQGQLSVVQRIENLPRLLRAEMDAQASPIQTGPLAVSGATPLPGQTAVQSWRPIAAYPVTRPRPGATTHLQSARGDPVLATWPLSSGRVMALTPGLGAWTGSWLDDPVLVGALADVMLWTAGRARPEELSLRLVQDGTRLLVRAEIVDAGGEWRSDQPLTATIQQPSGDVQAHEMTQTAPGLFSVVVPAAQQGVHDVTVSGPSSVARAAIWVANTEARQALDPRIVQLEGARVWTTGTGLLPQDWPVRSWPVRPVLLSLALALFVLIVTRELRPGWFSAPARWGRKAMSARYRGTGKRRTEWRG